MFHVEQKKGRNKLRPFKINVQLANFCPYHNQL